MSMPNFRTVRVIGWFAALVVLVVIFIGFLLVGSPLEARKRTADGERISDLQELAQRIRTYYSSHAKLPAGLRDLSLPSSLRTDPSGMPYEYRVMDKSKFELCTTFETDASKEQDGQDRQGWYYGNYSGTTPEFDLHRAGHFCASLPAKAPQ